MIALAKIPIQTAMGAAFSLLDTVLSMFSGVVSSADDVSVTALDGVRKQAQNLRKGMEDLMDNIK